MNEGQIIPDGNLVVRDDIPHIIKMIEHSAKWVNPVTFQRLPVWAPHTARGRPLYNAGWTKRATNTRKSTGETNSKFEGNVAALTALRTALDVARPWPKNWTVCHIWGYDDDSFATQSNVVKDLKYFSCIANMVWLPTPLKGFTDAVPEVKDVLRVCSFYLYGWACEHPSVTEKADLIRSGWIPDNYPVSWPTPERPKALPKGTAPFTKRVDNEITKRKALIRRNLDDKKLEFYPRSEVKDTLKFWKVSV